ncbi:unnamed protein product [Moneuplotes crassus]|uniref:Uncharacterized protein n=1 Tax=Euplotes crassus TaxID=5936 RepID=A0AAD2D4E8_EUPCR|nr:unnamed protein product [Moneuplotes crassus]
MNLIDANSLEETQTLSRRKSFHLPQIGKLSQSKSTKRKNSAGAVDSCKHRDKSLEEAKEILKLPEQVDRRNLQSAQDLGVPKFLVNKWLNVQNQKSKFVQKSCQIDNAADVSEYSVTSKTSKNTTALDNYRKESCFNTSEKSINCPNLLSPSRQAQKSFYFLKKEAEDAKHLTLNSSSSDSGDTREKIENIYTNVITPSGKEKKEADEQVKITAEKQETLDVLPPEKTPMKIHKKIFQLEFSSGSQPHQKFSPRNANQIHEKPKKLTYGILKEKKKVRSLPLDELVGTSKPILPISKSKFKPNAKDRCKNDSLLPSGSFKASALFGEEINATKTPKINQRYLNYPLLKSPANYQSIKRKAQLELKPKKNKIFSPVITCMKKRNLLVPIKLKYQAKESEEKSNCANFKVAFLTPFDEKNNKNLKDTFTKKSRRRDLSSYRPDPFKGKLLPAQMPQQSHRKNLINKAHGSDQGMKTVSSPKVFNPTWKNQFHPSYKLKKTSHHTPKKKLNLAHSDKFSSRALPSEALLLRHYFSEI